MKIFIPVIFLLAFTAQNFAQEYFPLQTGNSWELIGSCDILGHEAGPDTILLSIQKDSLFSNGKTYFVLSDSIGFGKFVRVESDIIYYYDEFNSVDVAVYDLNAPLQIDDSVAYGNSSAKYAVWLGEIYQDTIFNVPTNIIRYWVDGDMSFSISFSDKFGPVQFNNKVDNDPLNLWRFNIDKCKIEGVNYGPSIEPLAFPLAVNNSWTFYGTGQECIFNKEGYGSCLFAELRDTITFTVQKDTLMSNNKTYYKIVTGFIENPGFIINNNLNKPIFIRSDSNFLYVYDKSSESEQALIDLGGNLAFNDTVQFGPKPQTGYNIWITKLEEQVNFRHNVRTIFYYMLELDSIIGNTDAYSFRISEKFGFTKFYQDYSMIAEIWPDSSTTWYRTFKFSYELAECSIDGIVYSDKIGVSPDEEPNKPGVYSLSQNYPNPFNPSTTIEFAVPKQSHVKLAVYDVLGREIAVLANDVFTTGTYKATFNGANLPSGVYFYSIETGDFNQTKKFILLK